MPPVAPPAWLHEGADGQTPLDPDEVEGLRLAFVSTRGDLDIAEGNNIASGMIWAESRVRRGIEIANQEFLSELHLQLFGKVWNWAGHYRRTERSIGIDPPQIPIELKQLFDDVAAWREFNSYPLDEQAARLYHRLTWIHPFPNGNGRTSRAMANLFLVSNGSEAFSWGGNLELGPHEIRARHLHAVRAADGHDLAPLLAFVRT
jgi:Fic-DOC domain mobile mystery protein B